MNDTEIDYCDKTLNPYTGCWGPDGTEDHPRRCWYCYANLLAKTRLRGRAGYPADGDPFRPVFHRERLAQITLRQKPKTIFVGSMCDLWGDWVDQSDLDWIFRAMWDACQHRYLLLTKNPAGYHRIPLFPPGSDWWFGVTVTGESMQKDLRRLSILSRLVDDGFNTGVRRAHRWVSVEPYLQVLSPAVVARIIEVADWVVLGALTKYPASRASIGKYSGITLAGEIRQAGIPVFIKDPARAQWYGDFGPGLAPRELPWMSPQNTQMALGIT